MPSTLIQVFIIQVLIHIVNTVGASTINNLLWDVYNQLPTPTSQAAAEQRQLQGQFLRLRKELNSTSSQDEFAKWAKLRRQHDKVFEQLEQIKASQDTTKATFIKVVSGLRWVGTNGLRMFMQSWYSKQPIFWIPYGWVPYYVEWLLSFPRAPLGSISIQAWWLACASVILLISDAVFALTSLVLNTKPIPNKAEMSTPMKVAGNDRVVNTNGQKKEL